MSDYKSVWKYFLGAVAGITFVVGCGSGGSGMSVGSASAADPANPSDQLFCEGSPSAMAGETTDTITCISRSSSQPLTFLNFYSIAKKGWIMEQFSTAAGSGVNGYLFYK
jgi:hypothetical protein